jgi:hypothetical protein
VIFIGGSWVAVPAIATAQSYETACHVDRKIVLPVRFAEVKEEAVKPAIRRKTTLNAAGGHAAKRAGSTIHPKC